MRLVWLLWLLTFSRTLLAEQPVLPAALAQYLQQKTEIRYCVDPHWLPFEGLDDQQRHIGMSSGYRQFFQSLLPLPLVLVPTASWGESLEAIKTGRCELLLMAMATPAREEVLQFSPVYLTIPSAVVTLANKASLPELQQMTTARLGIRQHVGYIELYRSWWPQMQLVEVASYEEGLLMVQSGQLDGMFGNMGSLSYLLQQYKMTNLKIAATVEGESRMSVATRRSDPQMGELAAWLVGQITPAIQKQLADTWLPVSLDVATDKKLALQVIAAAVLLLSLAGLAYHKVLRLNQQLRLANQQLAAQTQHDSLTGLFNRQYLSAKLPELLSLCQRQQLPLTLAMIDLDHFKRLNDVHGHLFGDECLRRFAGLLAAQFQRPSDVLVRYGGEEFVLICIGQSVQEMAQQLEHFIRLLAGQPLPALAQQEYCTASIGWLTAIPRRTERAEAWLHAADQALYRAKSAGRNCCQQAAGPYRQPLTDATAVTESPT